MERYSNSTREVAQDGRRGALMLSVSIKHPDSEAFIDAKMTEGKVTGANVSVKLDDAFMQAAVNGTPYKVEMEKAPKAVVKPVVRPVATTPAAPTTTVVKPAAPSSGKSGVKSPLPGVILDIKVNVGDAVKKGQTIIILEAMKMENNINADKDGKITAINVSKGESVLEGTDLVIIE